MLSEEHLKKLKESWINFPLVNQSCIGCSACVSIASDVFELNDEWKSEVKFSNSYDKDDVDYAISACPVDAISWNK